MRPFLQHLAQTILQDYGKELGRICVVFPSRRATVFFNHYLAGEISKPVFPPEVLAFEDFIQRIHPVTLLDPVSLAFELFPLYQKYFPEETFEKFYSWAGQLLADFEDVDRALADANQIFSNIYELRRIDATIEGWLNDGTTPSDGQAGFLAFWKVMAPLYHALKAKLKANGSAWPGMAVRDAAQKLSLNTDAVPWKKVIFAGFNALTRADEQLIATLRDSGHAEVFFDMDRYYTEAKAQEAGIFYRKVRESWGNFALNWVEDHLLSEAKELTVSGVPQRVGQAKAAGLKVREWIESGVPEDRIAIVLPDENLLFPLLHSLPDAVRDINVTMGYPLRNTPLYSLVESILRLQEGADRMHQENPGNYLFYFRDVEAILRHPYIHTVAPEEGRELVQIIHADNRIYLSARFFSKFPDEHILRFIFNPWENAAQIPEFFMELFSRIKDILLRSEQEEQDGRRNYPSLELEILFRFFSLTQKLEDRIRRYAPGLDLKTFRKLFREVIFATSIPFSGEPLGGLQIMGTLETRALDFDHLIILSVNEGILPSGRQAATFIPFSLRKGFGLPTYQERDAVFAHHFYRLLQRPARIHLFYNTEADTFGSGEKSRFIEQIEMELVPRNPKINFKDEILTFPARKLPVKSISIEKTEGLQQQVADFLLENGLSPSGLGTFLECKLQFYFKYILGLYEEEEVQEHLEADTFGSVTHRALEILYAEYTGQVVGRPQIEKMKQRVEPALKKAFKDAAQTTRLDFGKNHLQMRVISDLLNRLLEEDASRGEFEIVGLEKRMEWTGELGGGQIRLKGIIDRVDRKDGLLRIIDYKTGRFEKPSITDFTTIEENSKRKKAALQLAHYAWLFFQTENSNEPIQASIYPLRKLSEGLAPLNFANTNDLISRQDLVEYQEFMKGIIHKILDPAVPFDQTEDETNCGFCPYRVICQRLD
ncbi:MAG: PD-(D/E)XK nuclease family protein [Bacteroidia bacterium]|nr:PD-(D/E)XK nuclease family protein [Bacteroidia bacterium]